MAGKYVLFDLDGTLSDSAPGILAALRHAFQVTGFPPMSAETELALLGPPFYESLPPLLGGPERLPEVIAAYRAHYGDTTGGGGMFNTVAYPGVPELVAQLHAAGHVLAVATSKPDHMRGRSSTPRPGGLLHHRRRRRPGGLAGLEGAGHRRGARPSGPAPIPRLGGHDRRPFPRRASARPSTGCAATVPAGVTAPRVIGARRTRWRSSQRGRDPGGWRGWWTSRPRWTRRRRGERWPIRQGPGSGCAPRRDRVVPDSARGGVRGALPDRQFPGGSLLQRGGDAPGRCTA